MEREGREGEDGTAEDAGEDYGLAGGNIQGNGYGGGMERGWLGKRLSMKRQRLSLCLIITESLPFHLY